MIIEHSTQYRPTRLPGSSRSNGNPSAAATSELLRQCDATGIEAYFQEADVVMPPLTDPWLACVVGAFQPPRVYE